MRKGAIAPEMLGWIILAVLGGLAAFFIIQRIIGGAGGFHFFS